MQRRPSTVGAGVVAAVLAVGLVQAPAASADPTIAGTYNSVAVKRVVDTRTGVGSAGGALAPGAVRTFTPAASLGTQSVSALALTVTAISPTRSGYLTTWTGATRPQTSTVNFVAGADTPNATVVASDATGVVSVYNGSAGTVQLAIDLMGYWTGGTVDAGTDGALTPLALPQRLTDSRTAKTPIAANTDASVAVLGKSGVPMTDVSAVAVNLTAIAPAARGYATATASATDENDENGGSRTATVNFDVGQSRSTLALVPVNSDGTVSVHNGSTMPLDYLVDVFGYVAGTGNPSAAGTYQPTGPYRAIDTRVTGTPTPGKGITKIAVFPDDGTSALVSSVVVHVTDSGAKSAGHLTAWSGDGAPPVTSVTNFLAAQARTGTAIVPVNSDGSISIYNASLNPVSLVVDVQGVVLNDLSGTDQQIRTRVQKALAHARAYSANKLAS